jgi:hypothetical protein
MPHTFSIQIILFQTDFRQESSSGLAFQGFVSSAFLPCVSFYSLCVSLASFIPAGLKNSLLMVGQKNAFKRKGGIRRRLLSNNPASNEHSLWLARKFLSGKMPATELHLGVTSHAKACGDRLDDLTALLSRPNKYENHAHRSMKRRLLRFSKMFSPYYADANLWDRRKKKGLQGR